MRLFIAIVTAFGLMATAAPIVIGIMSFDGTVVDKPYEQALLYDEIRRASAGWSLEVKNEALKKGYGELLFSLHGKDEDRAGNGKVLLAISRPSTAAYDKTYAVSGAAGGLFRAEVNFPLTGLWDVKVSFFHRGKEIVLEKRLFVE